ncbi:methylosome subunit pICln [Lutzomyia longipalpis]|uniref:methylosome subunit pICln n=1 Tax=Lutzomyia longipalpis TaxID=7200 RepID=UPI0024839649|nr:methylosome subunit pICln [Lutzomyia longipalpis]
MSIIGVINASPEETVYSQDNVKVQINKSDVGNGTLFLTKEYFAWKPENREEGISIPWLKISLHAISSAPSRSIYMILDFVLNWPGVYDANGPANGGGNAEPDVDEDEGNGSDASLESDLGGSELHLLPQNPAAVDHIYEAMNHCQRLHPDPTDSISDDEEEFMEAEEDVANIQNLHIDDADERFADAEEN